MINHKRKKSLLTVKESLGDSGRSSKSSSSLGQTGARRHKKESVRRLLPDPATPSDLPSLLGPAPAVMADQYGSFYLRLGTVCECHVPNIGRDDEMIFFTVFGIGSIIYVGIEMGGLFTLGLHSNKLVTCGDAFNILRPSLQILFIFMQMHFIFLNHKMNVFRRQLVSRLGLVHLLVTNLCVWVRALIIETVDEVMVGDLERRTRESDNETNTGLESLQPEEG